MDILRKAKENQFEEWEGHETFLVRKDGNEDYLNRVILDAVTSEGRDTDTVRCRFDEWELEDGSHWVSLDGNFCGYQRITRRVVFRLFNNDWIEKKDIILINENNCYYYYVNALG